MVFNHSFFLNDKVYESFKHAEWITYNSDSDIQYFRKNIYITEKVLNALLMVSASDRYEIFLNDLIIGKEVSDGWYPRKIYDITNKLNFGKNVLSIKVQKRKFNGEPKLIAELSYKNIFR